MYVCVCKAVSDSRIKRLVKDGATTLRDLSRETALGTCCGKCVPAAREVLSEALAAQPIRLADLVMGSPMTAAA
jgi:bacterioferritin-associated ferredoxin